MKKDGGLRAIFRHHLQHFHWVTIETAFIEAGIPDCNYCCHGNEGWIEFKMTSGWALSSLKQEQIAWLQRRARAGGRTFIAVRRLTKNADELWIFAGVHAAALKAHGLAAQVTLLYKGTSGPRAWDWACIEKLLKKHNN